MLCYKCGSHVPDGKKECPTCGQSLARPKSGDEKDLSSLIDDRRKKRTAARAASALLSPGEVLSSRYRLLDPIGDGGVGAVFRAHDQDIDVDVALKAIAPKLLQTPEEQKIFSQKIRQARKLHHANIVRIYDDGREQDHRFFTMQLLEGLTLRKVIDLRRQKGQPFVTQELEPIFNQLTNALEYAHRTTFHGDLKPSNIIILPDLLKLTDFCLIQALPLKPFLAIQKSRGNAFRYLAPEVRLEAAHIDGRADIYSIGVILAEMLTGEVFNGVFDKNFIAACKQMPQPTEKFLRRAIAEQTDSRFQTPRELMDELSELISAGHLNWLSKQPVELPARSEDDEEPREEPQYISGSSIVLLGEDEESEEATDPERDSEPEDRTPLERPQTVASDEAPGGAPGPPPLPADADDDDDEASGPSALAEEVRRITGESSDVYQRLTTVEDEADTPPGMKEADAGGNGAGGAPVPTPPPLPPDADEELLEDQAEEAEASEPIGIYDELTALSPYPKPTADGRVEPIPSPLPVVVPPPLAPVVPPKRRGSRERSYLLWALSSVALLAIIAYGLYYIRELQGEIDRQRQPSIAEASGDSGDLSGASATARGPDAGEDTDALPMAAADSPEAKDAEAARVKAEEEARIKAEEEARAKADEEARSEAEALAKAEAEAQAKADAEAQAKAAEEARVRAEEEARELAEKKRRAAASTREGEAQVAARLDREQAKRLAAEERRRQRDEARRAAKEARKEREATRQRELEEQRRREEEARERETRVAARAEETGREPTCPRGMAMIPAGSFKMGSAGNDPMRNYEERRLEPVELSSFCIDYYEYPNGKRASPRTGVSWFQAQSLCAARGKRLCSEQEWEKACKGPRGLRYPYGNQWDPEICNTEDADGTDRAIAIPVQYPRCRSGFGPIMLSGNAAEWTSTSFTPGAKAKVHKGGSADRPNWAARCANRVSLAPGQRSEFLGFRCCADPQ